MASAWGNTARGMSVSMTGWGAACWFADAGITDGMAARVASCLLPAEKEGKEAPVLVV